MKEILKDKRIAVLSGGVSSERDVSIKSGAAVYDALKAEGYDVRMIDCDRDICRRLSDIGPDVALLALHGGAGEDGSIQGMLEVMGVPYTGSGVLASATAMDKAVSKYLFKAAGITVPPFMVLEKDGFDYGTLFSERLFDLPWVVKPCGQGSSRGVNIVKEEEEFTLAVKDAFAFDRRVLVEKFIKGHEIHVGILLDRVLGAVEVRPGREFYDYKAKYESSDTRYLIPPEVDEEVQEKARTAGLAAYTALGCEGAARVDTIVSEDGAVYVLEVNTLPGMTEKSLLPKIAAHAGYSFVSLIEESLIYAIGKVERPLRQNAARPLGQDAAWPLGQDAAQPLGREESAPEAPSSGSPRPGRTDG
jgi:D-alanine-D-alanine ligase